MSSNSNAGIPPNPFNNTSVNNGPKNNNNSTGNNRPANSGTNLGTTPNNTNGMGNTNGNGNTSVNGNTSGIGNTNTNGNTSGIGNNSGAANGIGNTGIGNNKNNGLNLGTSNKKNNNTGNNLFGSTNKSNSNKSNSNNSKSNKNNSNKSNSNKSNSNKFNSNKSNSNKSNFNKNKLNNSNKSNSNKSKKTIMNSIKNTAKSVSNTVSNKLSDVEDKSGNLLYSIIKIVIVILILLALFYVTRYLMNSYFEDSYTSPYLLQKSKNAKHALVISQDPDNDSYIAMPRSSGESGLEFSYDYWLLIDTLSYKEGEWKHVFHKGNSTGYPDRAPGVWIHPNKNSIRVYMNTQEHILKDYVDIDNIPLQKWLHMSIVVKDKNLDIYVNGYLKKRKVLSSVPKQNYGNVWINMYGGFEGFMARMRYYARALTQDDIDNNVRKGPGNAACIDTGEIPPYLSDNWWYN